MIPLVKFKYKKSGKSIKLKDIANSMIDFSNRVSATIASSNSLSTKLVYSYFLPNEMKKMPRVL